MTDNDDDLLFSEDAEEGPSQPAPPGETAPRWKMLVVDDDSEVHSITRLVLADFSFKDRKAQFLSAYSAAEAAEILAREDDIAVILLDVVMETDDAGLRLVHHIREVLRNRHVRIILRTGQPGQAPERDVIVNYDINDYKAKTELTAQKLFTTTVAALRSYEDIMTIEVNRRGLEKIIEASSSLFQARSMKLFAAGVLTQLSALIGIGPDAILCVQRGTLLGHDRNAIYVLAGSGRYEALINEPAAGQIDGEVYHAVLRALEEHRNIYEPTYCTLYIRTPNDRENVVFLKSGRPLSILDQQLIEVFCRKISVGFDNLYMYEQLRKAQEAAVLTLANLAQFRDCAIGEHMLRVATTTDRLARRLRAEGMFPNLIDDQFLEHVGLASILHDVGRTISEDLLLRPDRLEPVPPQEAGTHPSPPRGLAGSVFDDRNYLALGAEIAQSHDENFDGTGLPFGLAGDAIPLAARIVAVADAYDVLTMPRTGEPPPAPETTLAAIRSLSGRRLDPRIVESFLKIVQA